MKGIQAQGFLNGAITITEAMSDELKNWVYKGSPDYIAINVSPASPTQGGYIMAARTASGIIRIAATRNPARYIRGWTQEAARFGHYDPVEEVFVSGPYIRYEAIKRILTKMIDEFSVPGGFRVDTKTLSEKMSEILGKLNA